MFSTFKINWSSLQSLRPPLWTNRILYLIFFRSSLLKGTYRHARALSVSATSLATTTSLRLPAFTTSIPSALADTSRTCTTPLTTMSRNLRTATFWLALFVAESCRMSKGSFHILNEFSSLLQPMFIWHLLQLTWVFDINITKITLKIRCWNIPL